MPSDPMLDKWHALDIFPAIFPRPALIHFFSVFAGEDLSALRQLNLQELSTKLKARDDVQNRLLQLIAEQPIYKDVNFLYAWGKAFWDLPGCTTGCLKMRFYAVVLDAHGQIVAESANRRMTECFGGDRFCTKNGCIRNTQASRTDAAIGDCGHAPLWCLSKLWGHGYQKGDLETLKIFEAGFYVPDFKPWISDDINYTCVQCQNEFAIFGVKSIFGVKYVNGVAQWVELPTSDNFYRTAQYAQGKKKA